jgi:hypothetical protein
LGRRHNLKFGGEVFSSRSTRSGSTDLLQQRDPDPAQRVAGRGRPVRAPGHLQGNLNTYSFYVNDMWRLSSPDHDAGPPVRPPSRVPPRAGASRRPFNPTEDTFPAVDDVVTWNSRAAHRRDLTISRQRQTVLKFNYGRYW